MQQVRLITVLVLSFLISATLADYEIVNEIDDFSTTLPLTQFNNAQTLSSFTEIGANEKRNVIISGVAPMTASIDNTGLSFTNNIQQVYYGYTTLDETPLPAFANANGATALAFGITFPAATKVEISIYCPTGRLDYLLNVANPDPLTTVYYLPFADFQVFYGSCDLTTIHAVVSYVKPPIAGNFVSAAITSLGTAKEAPVEQPCVPICGTIASNTLINSYLTVQGQGFGFNLASSCSVSPYAIYTFNSESFNYVFISTASYGGWGDYDIFLQKQGTNQCDALTQFKAYGRLLQTTVDNDSVYYIYVALGDETNPNSGILLQGTYVAPPENDLCTNAIDIGTVIQGESITVSGTTIGATNGDGQTGITSSVYYNFYSGDVEDVYITTCFPGSTTFDVTIHVGYNNLANVNTCPGGSEGCYWECGHNLHAGVDTYCLPEENTEAGLGVFRSSIPLQKNRNYFIEVGRHAYARSNQYGNGDFTFIIGSEPLCTPDCVGKQCGTDGCGGECGVCGNDETCTVDGTCLPILPVTLQNAIDITILPASDQELNINNVYDVSAYNPESPNDSCFTSTSNPIWYHVLPSNYQRTITISTCNTQVDTVIGAFLADGTRIDCNDDRDENSPPGDCNGLSSYIQFANAVGVDFYIVISGITPFETGNIDLRIQSQIEIEDLIEESTNIIVDALEQQISALSTDITTQIADLIDNSADQSDSIVTAIGDLSTSVNTQFNGLNTAVTTVQTTLQTDITTSTNSLSSQIADLSDLLDETPTSLSTIITDIGTVSTNVGILQNSLNTLSGDVSTVDGVVDGIATLLNTVSTNVNNLDSDVESVSLALNGQSSLVVALQTSVDNGFTGVNNNIDTLSDSVSSQFDDVSDSITAVTTIAGNILTGVSNGNAVTNNIYDFIRSAYFETFLLSGTTAVNTIPWKWRTPAAANGSMDDILVYLTSLYNSKLAACQGVNNANCNSFRQTATPAFATLQTSYNNQVAAFKYKKAFQVLQVFYLNLFPTSNWQ